MHIIFNELKINRSLEVMKHQNKYPVIFITLKDMKNMKYENQIEQFVYLMTISKAFYCLPDI